MEMLVNGRRVVFKESFSFDFVFENRAFSGADDYSFSIDLPIAGCPENEAIFGFLYRKDFLPEILSYDCILRDGALELTGILTLVGVSQTDISCQFLSGKSETNLVTALSEIYINTLDLGTPPESAPSPSEAWNVGADSIPEAVPLPWVNQSSGAKQNEVTYNNGVYTWVPPESLTSQRPDKVRLSWMPYLYNVAVNICKAIQFTCDFSEWFDCPAHRYLLCCNALPISWGHPEYAKALPHWSVEEFFEKLELLLVGEFDINLRTRHISFRYTRNVLAEIPSVRIDSVVDVFSSEIAESPDDMDYLPAKNLQYADCDHAMSPFYTCQWFVDSLHDAYTVTVRNDPRGYLNVLQAEDEENTLWAKVRHYKTFADLAADLKRYMDTIRPFVRGAVTNELLYVDDVEELFVARCIGKLADSAVAGGYHYYLAPCSVNAFGPRIVNPDSDSFSEIEFVPVCIDSPDYGEDKLPFLYPSSADSDADAEIVDIEDYDPYEESYIPANSYTRRIEAGESDKSEEYYDKIFIGWFDGSYVNGRLPRPFIDSIETESDWSFFKPRCNLRLNTANSPYATQLPQIDSRFKYSFSFLTETPPNPRAIFHICGKRYVCEKITATFTENGMSQLLKGSFYPLLDPTPEDATT